MKILDLNEYFSPKIIIFLSKHRKANQGRTEIIRNDLNPVWNYKTVFSIFRKNIQIQIQVKEWAKNLILYRVWTIV